MTIVPERLVACAGLTDLFYGPEDGRTEAERSEREAQCKQVCAMCPVVLECLERALVLKQPYGVWGGMTEQERREFRAHLKDEGYGDDIPESMELWASVHSYFARKDTIVHPAKPARTG